MKKLILISILLSLTACFDKKQEEPKPTPTINTSSESTSSIRQNFTQACVQSALGDKPASPEKQQFAQQTCDCVYDEGIKAYGSQNEWENAIKDFDKSVNDPKLQQISNDTINICIAKFTSNQATASASSASPAK